MNQHLAKLKLPPPQTQSGTSVAEALAGRRSVREFTNTGLTNDELAQLLWATQGISGVDGLRTSPSAGALYPLELYVATADGVYHYEPASHMLNQHVAEDIRPALWKAALAQDAVRQAPAVFVLSAVYRRTSKKYGKQRSPRYVHMEAGHAAQNLLLQAAALGLAGVLIGAFEDDQVGEILALPRKEVPLYLIPLGHAR